MKSVRLSNFPHSPGLCSFCFQMQGTFVCPHRVVSFSFCSPRVCPGARENVAMNLDMHLFGFKFYCVTELKSRAIPLMSCSTGFILNLDFVSCSFGQAGFTPCMVPGALLGGRLLVLQLVWAAWELFTWCLGSPLPVLYKRRNA